MRCIMISVPSAYALGPPSRFYRLPDGPIVYSHRWNERLMTLLTMPPPYSDLVDNTDTIRHRKILIVMFRRLSPAFP